jgi:hypothetical protein
VTANLDSELPPRPEGPTEKQTAELARDEAATAVELAERRDHRGAELAFFRSWRSVMEGHAAMAVEDEARMRAWDRVHKLEELLERMAEVADDATRSHGQRVAMIQKLLRDGGA